MVYGRGEFLEGSPMDAFSPSPFFLKNPFFRKNPQVLGVCGLQFVPGAIGTMLIAVFANSDLLDDRRGMLYCEPNPPFCGLDFLAKQTFAVLVVTLYAGGMTLLVMKILTLFLKNSVDVDVLTEMKGLDATQIGEIAYKKEDLHIKYHLYEACRHGDLIETLSLLTQKAEVNCKDYDGRTPLHLACAADARAVVELLVNARADVSAEDRWMHRPVDDVCDKKLVAWLLEEGK